MPWVRIDENAMDDPKLIALSANAFRLWCEGQSHCQKFLTDGLIPLSVLKGLRYYSSASLKLLTSILVPGKGPLWHLTETGVQVHDYLDWNDSRAAVLKAREEAKARKRRWLDARAGSASGDAFHQTGGMRSETRVSLCDVVCSEDRAEREGRSGETNRVQRFIDRYGELHEHYLGVAYLGNPQKDYQAACELVAAFDDETLEKIAVYGLNDTSAFMSQGTRTVTKLKSQASGYVEALKARKLA